MATTTWNPSDKAAQVTLSNGNLTATCSTGQGGGRAVDRQVAGKFYWEVTPSTFAAANSAIGLMSAGATLTGWWGNGGASLGTCGINHSGNAVVDGAGSWLNPAFGTIAAGTVICIAVDLTARLIWYRLGAAGNWNNSATANPATGAGGGPISNQIGAGLGAFPGFWGDTTGEVFTANFGGSAFTGAVPSGFTAGFTAGSVLPTSAVVTQASAEHFFATNPNAQVTQVAVEHFFAPASLAQVTQVALEEWGKANPLAQVTQVALEEWGSVATITLVPGRGEADAAAAVAGAGAIVTALPVGIGEVDAGAVVTGAGAVKVLPIGAGEVDAAAAVTGAGRVQIEPLGVGEVDAAAVVTGAGAVIPVAAGRGEADAAADVRAAGFQVAVGTGEVDAFADVRGMGAIIAPPNALPFLPGLGWSVHRRPTFDTIVAPHPSGAEVRLALWQNALWEFELSYDALASNAAYPGVWTDTLQTLMGFYLARGGARGSFLFIDPDFNSMTGQGIGAGDGTTVAFSFVRTFGGQIEPIGWVTAVAAVYLNGVATASGWTVSGNTITFASPPASGVVISADFSYGFVCRFLEDTLDFEEFMDNLWQLKSLKFRQVRL